MALQMAAAERLERAETEVRIAAIRIDTLVAEAPLRFKVEATARYRRARDERDAAQAAYDAAQDLECPEASAMTTIDRLDLAAEVAEIREGLGELQERVYRVMQEIRRLPGGDWLYQRVDAYPGVRLDRDMGAGQDADGWLAEVARFLEDEGEPAAG